jgi:hypothetical protein
VPGNRVPCKIFVNRLRVITENNVATCLARASRICSSSAPGETRGAATLRARGDARIPARIKRKFTTCIFMEISICPARERDFRSRSGSPKRIPDGTRAIATRINSIPVCLSRSSTVLLCKPGKWFRCLSYADQGYRCRCPCPEYVIRPRDPSVRPDTRAYLRGLLSVAGSIAGTLPAA